MGFWGDGEGRGFVVGDAVFILSLVKAILVEGSVLRFEVVYRI